MTYLLSLILKFASSKLVKKSLDFLRAQAAEKTGQARIEADVTIAQIEAATKQTQIMADLNKDKFTYWVFWLFAGLFVVPLAAWWIAVILDSIFLFGWGVATVPVLEEWGGQMIQWLFYVGGGVGVIKMLK